MNLGQRLSAVWQTFVATPEMTIGMVVSILVFTVLYYYMIKFLFDNESGTVAVLFVMVSVIAAVMLTLKENINSAIYLIVPAVFIVAIMVLYSTEIKRVIWARKHNASDVGHGSSYDEERIQTCIAEIIKALQNMSKNDVGAIVVLSTGNVPGQILDSGVRLDSDISSELIESVFFPKTPLHDGAMVINGTKIVAAGCFLPLSQNVDGIPKDLGTRHRAGIGVTETIDVMSIIVSEETGVISIANGGKIKRYADSEMLRQTLTRFYAQEDDR